MLGGSLYQTYAIKEAKRLGYYVISCDYLPSNPGHKYSDEYHNVSTTDKEAVLKLAKNLKGFVRNFVNSGITLLVVIWWNVAGDTLNGILNKTLYRY